MSPSKMKVSLITLSFNSVESLSHTIASVNAQTYGNIEHVIKDGSSSDGSFKLAKSCATRSPVVVSKDDMGIYDALNQALDLATGDIIGVVHSGDVLGEDKTVEKVVDAFAAEDVDVVWGNLNITSAQSGRVLREWRSKPFSRNSLYFGWMDKQLIFNEVTLEEAMKSISRWFGYEYEIKKPFNRTALYNSKHKNPNLREVMESLSFAYGLEYEINGNKIIVK